MNIGDYASLPWTVHGRAERETNGETCYLITVDELPGFSVAAGTRGEAEADFRVVLEEYLAAAIESGAEIPVPA